MRRATLVRIALTIGLVLAYAVVRYLVFGPVSVENLPAYLLNKTLAVASVIFLLFAGVDHRHGKNADSRGWGRASLHAALVHVLLSLVLMTPGYFGMFYGEGGKLNLSGEVVLGFGALAAWTFVMLSRNRIARLVRLRRRLIVASAVLIFGHLLPMGLLAGNWWHPGRWPG